MGARVDSDGSDTKFCFKCWSKVPADAEFCEVCGAVFQDEEEKYIPDNNPVRTFEEAPIKMKKPSRMWIAIPLALVVFVAAILIIFSGVFNPQLEQSGLPYSELSHEWSADGGVLYVMVEIVNDTDEPIRGSSIVCYSSIGSGTYQGTFTSSPKEIMAPGDSCKCSLKFSVLPKDSLCSYRLTFSVVR